MKHFIKVFSIAFLCFILAIGAGLFTYFKFNDMKVNARNVHEDDSRKNNNSVEEDNKDGDEPKDPLKLAIKDSERINVLLLGLEGPRSDTIIFASFDPKTKKIDLISIPRDTYFYRKGFESMTERKINAVYDDAGFKGTMNAVSNILGGVPVHHYVSVSYKGVAEIVDSLGGVEVDVPFDMVYDDPNADPPLHINISKGRQILKGEKAVHFLRFRKSNDGKIDFGDLGRIKHQQQFLKSAIKKALSFRLPSVINTCYKYVKTDVTLSEAILYAKDALGFKMDNVSTTLLPGTTGSKSGISFFYHDPKKVRELMGNLYGVELEDESDE